MKNSTNDKKEIIKSNNLIEGSYRLSAMEQKIIYYGATMLNKEILMNDITISEVQNAIKRREFPILRINACDFQKAFGMKTGSIYSLLDEASKKLYERDLIYKDSDGAIVHKRWVITSRYDEKNARIDLEFHPDLLYDLLIFTKNFTIFKLKDAKSIKSGHAYRFYELLKQYEKLGVRTISVEELKFKLGISDEEYPSYGNFNQSVISPSIKNINKYTDLEITKEEIKDKKKVIKIRFYIKKKDKSIIQQLTPINDNGIDDSQNEIITKIQAILNYDITAGQAQKIFNCAFESIEKNNLSIDALKFIQEKKKIVDEYNKKHEIKSYIGMLIKAIQENWSNNSKPSNFNNYEQRSFDPSIETRLLGWETKDSIKPTDDEEPFDNEFLQKLRLDM